MRVFRAVGAGLAAVAVMPAPSVAADYSAAVFFGDSLSDSGTFAPLLPQGGKFTTNPGPVWAENLAAAYGYTAAPAASGGSDHAVGGARVSLLPGQPATAPTATAAPVRSQITAYLAANGGRADPDALYTVWAGANDLFVAIASPATAQAAVGQAAVDLVGEVARLKAAGARTVLVPTMPDIGLSPLGRSQGAAGAAAITQLVGGYNQAVYQGLAAAGVAAIPVDTFGLLRAAAANPAAYGFANVTGTACTTSSALLCTASTLTTAGAAESYLFADGVHPTTAGHRAISDFTLNVLTAPVNVGLLAESPLRTRERLIATIQAQAMANLWGRKTGEAGVWVAGGAGRSAFERQEDRAGARGTPLDLSVGIDKRLGDGLLAGAALSASRVTSDFSTGGDYRQTDYGVSVYGTYRIGGARVGGVATVGRIDDAVRRSVTINGTDHGVRGDTDGTSLSAAAEAGYDFTTAGITHGPLAGLRYQRVRVDGFQEDDPLFGFRYAAQTRHSLVGTLGYQASYDLGAVLPYGRVALNREFRDDQRMISAANPSLPALAYQVATARPDRAWTTVAGGAAVTLASGVTGTLGMTARFGDGHGSDWGGFVGLGAAF